MSLSGFISYKRVGWTGQTPWNPTNLNIMDKGIKDNNDMIANLRDEVSALNNNFGLQIYEESIGMLGAESTITINFSGLVQSRKILAFLLPCSQSATHIPISIAFSGTGGVVEVSERYAITSEPSLINCEEKGKMVINIEQLTPGQWGLWYIIKLDKNLKFTLA